VVVVEGQQIAAEIPRVHIVSPPSDG
jgi:hypothetical protein